MLNASRGGKPPVKPNTAFLVVTVSVAAVSAAAVVHLFADAVAADAADGVTDVVHPVGRQGSPVVPVAVVVFLDEFRQVVLLAAAWCGVVLVVKTMAVAGLWSVVVGW